MTLITPKHELAHTEQMKIWLNAQEGVRADCTTEIEVDHETETAVIRQFKRDADDGMVLLEVTEDGRQPIAQEDVTVVAPDWLLAVNE